jgi:hypothetical protein
MPGLLYYPILKIIHVLVYIKFRFIRTFVHLRQDLPMQFRLALILPLHPLLCWDLQLCTTMPGYEVTFFFFFWQYWG